jgi:hypothetical protein
MSTVNIRWSVAAGITYREPVSGNEGGYSES